MKILKSGNTWKALIKCSGKGTHDTGCNAKLEIKEEDLIVLYGGGYNEAIPYMGIQCPECKVSTCLEDAKIKVPNQIFLRVLEKDRTKGR